MPNSKYKRFNLTKRYGSSVLPDIQVIDMRKEKLRSDHGFHQS